MAAVKIHEPGNALLPVTEDRLIELKRQIARLQRENGELRSRAAATKGCASLAAFLAIVVGAMFVILYAKLRYFS